MENEYVTKAEYVADKRTTDERLKRDYERLNKIEDDQESLRDMAKSVAVLATKQDQQGTDIREIKTDVKALAEKPARRWDGAVDKVIMLVVGAVVALILSKFGM
ncbi:MAG: hypothetical protein LKJ86_08170 [Oscillibacter sp.]|jgi:hypothetical protein|nr:hypothetical protein [Oscillibacter sp.]